MKHVLFGRSGLRVSELCLGAMPFGNPDERQGASAQDSRAMFDLFANAGGTFIDTAENYGQGASETMVGEFIKADRDHFTVATKYSATRAVDLMKSGNSRKNMMRAIDDSLRKLQTDRVDLFYLHVWDFTTPWDEIMRGLDDLVRTGKVIYVAVSDTPAWEISRANMLADLRGWSPFIGLQTNYNLGERTSERELLPMAKALGLGVTAWGPLGGGVMTGRYTLARGADAPLRRKLADIPERRLRLGELVAGIAREQGVSAAQVALAWLRAQSQFGPIVPIIGPRTPAQTADCLKCLDVTLDAANLKRLDEASRIELGFPHDFVRTESSRGLVHGQQESLLSGHRNRLV